MTTESLLVVIVLMAVGYIFIATVCWIRWSHDKDLHARIDAAAALRGEMAPLPPRSKKKNNPPSKTKP